MKAGKRSCGKCKFWDDREAKRSFTGKSGEERELLSISPVCRLHPVLPRRMSVDWCYQFEKGEEDVGG